MKHEHVMLNDLTSEQRRVAMDFAKEAVGVLGIPDHKLTPMALFLMSAVASECCLRAHRGEVGPTLDEPEMTA